ncbi:hypothetical protein V2J09_011817 [Rumex salicifolius]
MGDNGNGQMGFQQNSELMLSCCPSSGMNTSERVISGLAINSMFDSSNGGKESCYVSGWENTVPLSQNENLGVSLMAPSVDLAMSGTSQFMHYSSDAKFPVFGGGNFSGMVNSYNLPGCAQNSGVFGPTNHALSKNLMVENRILGSVQYQENLQTLEDRSLVASPNGKRKRNGGGDMQRDSSAENLEMKESDEKKQKIEESGSSDQSNKKSGRQTKDNFSGEEDSKGYIHVRARKGQATNSHSLAERVRREKINDRMRLLQELVPGCSKITGKAVMLDEIINYVQSLQQQVEFLSMKLASVNPENLHSRGILGFNLGTSSAQLNAPAIISNSTSLYHPIPQGLWDGDMQNLQHMGFDPNPAVGNLRQNGTVNF